MTALLLLVFVPMRLNAEPENNSSTKDETEVVISDEAVALMDRLEEIEAIDKSNLTPAEKRKLRKEVRGIKKELKELSGGIYISAGALIVILLLIIIL